MEILEVKNTIANFKNAMNRLNGKMEGTEERISELEYGKEMIQPEQVKENEQENVQSLRVHGSIINKSNIHVIRVLK